MYEDGDLERPVTVHFVYGRAQGGDRWGWLAQANVGHIDS